MINRKRNYIVKHGGKATTKRTSAATCVCRTRKGNIIRKNHPLDLLGEKAMKEGIGRALEISSGVTISLAIVFHLECAELTKFQDFLKMVLRSKAQQESIIRSKRGKTVQESLSSTTSPGVGSERKKSTVSCLELMLLGTYVTQNFFINA